MSMDIGCGNAKLCADAAKANDEWFRQTMARKQEEQTDEQGGTHRYDHPGGAGSNPAGRYVLHFDSGESLNVHEDVMIKYRLLKERTSLSMRLTIYCGPMREQGLRAGAAPSAAQAENEDGDDPPSESERL